MLYNPQLELKLEYLRILTIDFYSTLSETFQFDTYHFHILLVLSSNIELSS